MLLVYGLPGMIANVACVAVENVKVLWKVAKGEIVIFTGDDIFPDDDFVNGHYENYSGGAMGQIGIGLDYRLHYDWSWNLEIGGQYPFKHGMDMFAGIYVSTGLTYNF